MKVWTVYRSLGAEQKRILREKKVELDRPIDEILDLLKPLAACDKLADKSRTKMGCSFAFGIVAIIALAIVLTNAGWSAVTFLIFAIALAAVIVVATLYFFMRSIDLSNNFREFALPVLTIFREDFDDARPVYLRLNLDPPTAPGKKRGESTPYKQGVYHKIIDTTYVDPWMSTTAVLVDGTKLSWSVTDEVRERTKTKRTPRGKYKTKTKYLKKTDIQVEVGLRKKSYEVTVDMPGRLVTSGMKRNRVRQKREFRTDSLEPLSPRVLIDAVAGVYRNTRKAPKEIEV
jgi:hypothetical protein